MTMDDLLELMEKLTAILKDPQPGLSTWQRWRAETGRKLRDALTQKLDAPSSEPEVPTRLTLEATGVIVISSTNRSSWRDETISTVELRTLTPVGDVPSPLRAVTLKVEVTNGTWGAINDTLGSPKGRVRMRFDFYVEGEGEGSSHDGPALPGGTF